MRDPEWTAEETASILLVLIFAPAAGIALGLLLTAVQLGP